MFKKYLTLIRAGIIESIQFRLALFVMFLGNLLYLVVVFFLWKAIYNSSGSDIVNGMSFVDTLIYLVLATSLFRFMEMHTVWEMGDNIKTGKIVVYLTKPLKYYSYLFWSHSGSLIINFLFTFLPTFIIVFIVTNGYINLGVNILLFILSVLMSIIINYSIDFIVGAICLYTESIWGINIMKQVIVLLLSGATIPIAFFPHLFKKIIYCLPFHAIYNTPLIILLDSNSEPSYLFKALIEQFIWCIIMIFISKIFWNKSIRRIVVNGG